MSQPWDLAVPLSPVGTGHIQAVEEVPEDILEKQIGRGPALCGASFARRARMLAADGYRYLATSMAALSHSSPSRSTA